MSPVSAALLRTTLSHPQVCQEVGSVLLSSLSIPAGIETSATVTVVIATLATFIGGGRHGTVIVRGLALYDKSIILAGALPAAIMSLAIHVVSKCSTVF